MKIKALRLTQGTDLRQAIEQYCISENIASGAVISAVGCLSRARIRIADGVTVREYDDRFEICSLMGTLSADGVHLHISLADSEGKMIGGHLAEGCIVNTTVELVLADLSDQFTFNREYDPSTGYRELIIHEKD